VCHQVCMQVLDPDLDTGYGFNSVEKKKFIHKKKGKIKIFPNQCIKSSRRPGGFTTVELGMDVLHRGRSKKKYT
jgi:hypothetical protein